MSEFDYRKFLAENKLTKVSRGRETGKAQILSEGIQIREGFDMDVDTEMDEANAQKDAYLKRKEREKRGNWGGSVGAFVEKHGEDLGRVGTNRQALVDYIETTMKPELNDEAKAYVDNLVATTKSSFKLLQALYNATMAGSGLRAGAGSLREEYEGKKAGFDPWEEADRVGIRALLTLTGEESVRDEIRRNLYNGIWPQGEGDDDELIDYEIEKGTPDGTFDVITSDDLMDIPGMENISMEELFTKSDLVIEIHGFDWSLEIYGRHLPEDLHESMSVSKKYPQEKGSRTSVTSKKYKGRKAGDGQDRMAKSEMTGEKVDVTIGGVTKSIPTKEYKKYRKMTDPEEKKAWKKKHGFVK